jgi:hypothetical protein
MPQKSLEERFHEQYIRLPESGCWLWTGTGVRYGQIKKSGDPVPVGAHRVSWELHFGEIPDGLCVLHKCDVTACVNPDHLFLGTKKDNAVDRMNKGRGFRPIGEKNGRAKFSDDEIAEIRNSAKSIEELADQYDVSDTAIYFIINGYTWRHIK